VQHFASVERVNVHQFDIPGLTLIVPKRFSDTRGHFSETWSDRLFREKIENVSFVQDNQSMSAKKATVRGLLRSRSKCFSLRIRSQGPLPRMATRRAQRVMRKRDQGLWVARLDLQLVSPGGKRTGGLHQTMGQSRRDQSSQHPAFSCGTLASGKGIKMEQRF
jgi:hypothetical protein